MVDDDNGNSAGTIHKWGAIKTQYGYFFPCESQNCFYQFDGQKLSPISDKGIKNDIYYKIPISVTSQMLPGLKYYNDEKGTNMEMAVGVCLGIFCCGLVWGSTVGNAPGGSTGCDV